MQKMQLFIAIPSYNRADALRTLLGQLQVQKTDYDFVVVALNDGGNEQSEAVLKQALAHGLRLVWNKTSRGSGLPSARNKILDTIERLYNRQPTTVVFLDDDCEVDEDFAQRLYEASLKYDGFTFAIETVGRSGIVNTKDNPLVSRLLAPALGRAWLKIGFLRGGYFQRRSVPVRVDHLPGGCLAYRFDKYKELRFDPQLNDGNSIAEDTDFSRALSVAGAQLWYCGYYGIIHRPPSRGGVRVATSKEKYYYYWRNKQYLCNKWEGRRWNLAARTFTFFEAVVLSVMHRTWLLPAWLKAGRQIFNVEKNERLSILAPISGINPDSTFGGEVYDAHLLSALSTYADVHVLVPEGGVIADGGSGWSVTTFSKPKSSLRYYFRQLRLVKDIYRKRPFDILWVHSPYTMAPFMLMCKLWMPGIKIHAQFLHRETSFSRTLLTWFGLHFWDSMSSCSAASVKDIVEYFGFDDSRFVVAYPGVSDVPELPVETEPKESDFLLLHVGSLIKRKNVSFLLDVMAACGSDVSLVVLGDGPQRENLEQKAEQLGLDKRVQFLGRCSDEQKHSWMQRADVLVLASLREGFGMVVTEAATHGTPSLVSDRFSLPEVVLENQTGLVRSLEINAWVSAIADLKDNSDKKGKLGQRAKEWTASQFSWDVSAQRVHKHLKTLL